MKCPHCGEELPEGFVYVAPDEAPDTISDEEMTSEENETTSEAADEVAAAATAIAPVSSPEVGQYLYVHENAAKRHRVKAAAAAICASVVVAAVGVGVALDQVGKAHLKESLIGTWEGSGSMMTEEKLIVSGDTITYSQSFGFMEMDGGTYAYKILSDDTIKIRETKIHVDVDKNNGTLTFTPGLKGGSAETWYSPSALRQDSGEQSGTDGSNDGENSGVL